MARETHEYDWPCRQDHEQPSTARATTRDDRLLDAVPCCASTQRDATPTTPRRPVARCARPTGRCGRVDAAGRGSARITPPTSPVDRPDRSEPLPHESTLTPIRYITSTSNRVSTPLGAHVDLEPSERACGTPEQPVSGPWGVLGLERKALDRPGRNELDHLWIVGSALARSQRSPWPPGHDRSSLPLRIPRCSTLTTNRESSTLTTNPSRSGGTATRGRWPLMTIR